MGNIVVKKFIFLCTNSFQVFYSLVKVRAAKPTSADQLLTACLEGNTFGCSNIRTQIPIQIYKYVHYII